MKRCDAGSMNTGMWPTFVENCRPFGEPPRDREAIHHPGIYPANLANLAKQGRFRNWLRSFKHSFNLRARGPPAEKPLIIVMFCTHGRHRSVATTYLLHSILQRAGYQASMIHMGQDHETLGWSICPCKGRCDLCLHVSPASQQAVADACAEALRVWESGYAIYFLVFKRSYVVFAENEV